MNHYVTFSDYRSFDHRQVPYGLETNVLSHQPVKARPIRLEELPYYKGDLLIGNR